MLDPDYSWLLNCNVGQQFADHTLDVSLPSCPDSTYTLAGLDLHSTAETETSSPFATAAVDPSQPPLWSETYPFLVSQDISFPLFSLDPNFSVIDSTPAFLAADQDPTLLSACQGDNFRSLSANEVAAPTSGAQSQLDCEQPQQEQQSQSQLAALQADTSRKLNRQEQRIKELELALEQLRHAGPEIPQGHLTFARTFIGIPRQFVDVQTNLEQYLGRFMEWVEEQGRTVAELEARTGGTLELAQRLGSSEADIVAFRGRVDSST
ncbi:hypothetical protein N0V87_010711 [Didymella glomerata]|uniref:Uncharacterized protein n=1 Tax=Didymella glomerata TaxID=749621 RepID=A0A9W8WPP8_9PLEO|nr:hypothetical protein N0V87_010711 [Didymella glomerata]